MSFPHTFCSFSGVSHAGEQFKVCANSQKGVPQFMGSIRYELPVMAECLFYRIQQLVDRGCKLANLILGHLRANALAEVLSLGNGAMSTSTCTSTLQPTTALVYFSKHLLHR